jgi:putative SOS response-associated peptidase YedK
MKGIAPAANLELLKRAILAARACLMLFNTVAGQSLANRVQATGREKGLGVCGRFTLTSSSEALEADFEVSQVELFKPRFNIAPSQEIVVVREDESGARECVALRWGMIPAWTKDPKKSHAPINARSETAASKPTFRQAMSRRRCLVPASGFYEWRGKGGEKQAYYFYMQKQALFAIAGLFEVWRGEGGEIIESVALLTSDANPVVSPVHARMPVILAKSNYQRWLDRENLDSESVADLMSPCPVDWFTSIPVSSRVNSPSFDEPACIEAVATQSVLALG